MVKNRKNKPDHESHRRYLDNQMTPDERHEYERMLQKDPFAADAADGFASLKDGELSEDMATLSKRLRRRYSRIGWLNIAGYAAAVAVVVAATFLIVKDAGEPRMVLSENVPEMKGEVEEVENVENVEEVEKVEKSEKVEKVEKVEEVERVEEVKKVEGVEVVERMEEERIDKKLTKPAVVSEAMEVVSAPARADQAPIARKEYQIKAITGKVVSSEDGEPIPGVSISLQGKVAGVVTDIDGNFRINADSTDILRVNFIGMKSLEMPASMASKEKIVMDPDFLALEEVVVTGVGTKKARSGATGSVTVIDLSTDDERVGYQGAMPDGGFDLFRNYISENVRFPQDYQGSGREVVRLKFHLDIYGNISDIEIIRSPGEYFSKEAERLLKEGPMWNASMMDGKPVAGRVTIRIVMEKRDQ